jgi:hypothetical protein
LARATPVTTFKPTTHGANGFTGGLRIGLLVADPTGLPNFG